MSLTKVRKFCLMRNFSFINRKDLSDKNASKIQRTIFLEGVDMMSI